jgi:hypothetical protein
MNNAAAAAPTDSHNAATDAEQRQQQLKARSSKRSRPLLPFANKTASELEHKKQAAVQSASAALCQILDDESLSFTHRFFELQQAVARMKEKPVHWSFAGKLGRTPLMWAAFKTWE